MLSINDAKKIGCKTCMDALGFEFCKEHAENSTFAWGEDNGILECFVGISAEPARNYDIEKVTELKLTHEKWPYAARCKVYLDSGKITVTEVRIMDNE